MEFFLTMSIFGVAMTGMALGVIVKGQRLRGSCGGPEVVTSSGDPLSCGACPKNEAELCPSEDNLIRLSQIGHPDPTHHR
jgi:hypothetical protein